MDKAEKEHYKAQFQNQLAQFATNLPSQIADDHKQWTIKGFIDIFHNIYTISTDTKIVSKILEIHLFPQMLAFAQMNGYRINLTTHQNYYPDLSFIDQSNEQIKFAVDLKTTYRLPQKPQFCNGFTLGSHGEYFINRNSTKNIQYPYNQYLGHFCLGIIYSREHSRNIDETLKFSLDNLPMIHSVISNFQFFVWQKWQIASDRSGSGNTANIGSINYIPDILTGNGMFTNLGEEIFDDYWINYGRISILDDAGNEKKIRTLRARLGTI